MSHIKLSLVIMIVIFVVINYENNSTLYDKETMQSVTLEMIKFVILKLMKK